VVPSVLGRETFVWAVALVTVMSMIRFSEIERVTVVAVTAK